MNQCNNNIHTIMQILSRTYSKCYFILALLPGLSILFTLPEHSKAACAQNVTLSSNPSPIANQYPADTYITFTITIGGYTQIASNWLHSIVLNLDNNWDATTITPVSIPNSVSGNGNWGYYPTVLSTGSGITYGPGFYFDYNTTINLNDGNPGNNFGDQNINNQGVWVFVFKIKTATSASSIPLNITFCVNGDGTTGSWNSGGLTCSCDAFNFSSLISNNPCQASFSISGWQYAGWPINFSGNGSPSSATSQWWMSDGLTSSNQSLSHTFFSPDTYTICYAVVENGFCADTLCMPLTIVEPVLSYLNYYPFHVIGNIFYDTNQDGIHQPYENWINNLAISTSCAGATYYTNNDGSFNLGILAGNCSISPQINTAYSITSGQDLQNIIIDTSVINLGNIGIYAPDEYWNPEITLTQSLIQCNIDAIYILQVKNQSNQNANTVVTLSGSDDFLSHVSLYEPVDTVGLSSILISTAINPSLLITPTNSGAGFITYDLATMTPFQTNNYLILYDYPVVAFDTVAFEASCIFNNITNSTSIVDSLFHIVACSYDPNSKESLPNKGGLYTAVQQGEEIVYTINFQNTGNAPAHVVVIKDTLSEYIDASSFVFLYGLHPVEVLRNGFLLEFIHLNIMLPDSSSNEEESKGFVKFKVRLKNNLPESTSILNNAAIYFDLNEPIITNTTQHHIPLIINDNKSISNNNDINVYPNPTSLVLYISSGAALGDVVLYDLPGRVLLEMNKVNKHQVSIDMGALADGVYFLKAGRHKMVKVIKGK